MKPESNNKRPSRCLARLVRRWLTAEIHIERLPDSFRKTIRRLKGRLRAWDVEYRPYKPEHDDSVTRDRWPATPELLRVWIVDRWLIRISPNSGSNQ